MHPFHVLAIALSKTNNEGAQEIGITKLGHSSIIGPSNDNTKFKIIFKIHFIITLEKKLKLWITHNFEEQTGTLHYQTSQVPNVRK